MLTASYVVTFAATLTTVVFTAIALVRQFRFLKTPFIPRLILQRVNSSYSMVSGGENMCAC